MSFPSSMLRLRGGRHVGRAGGVAGQPFGQRFRRIARRGRDPSAKRISKRGAKSLSLAARSCGSRKSLTGWASDDRPGERPAPWCRRPSSRSRRRSAWTWRRPDGVDGAHQAEAVGRRRTAGASPGERRDLAAACLLPELGQRLAQHALCAPGPVPAAVAVAPVRNRPRRRHDRRPAAGSAGSGRASFIAPTVTRPGMYAGPGSGGGAGRGQMPFSLA